MTEAAVEWQVWKQTIHQICFVWGHRSWHMHSSLFAQRNCWFIYFYLYAFFMLEVLFTISPELIGPTNQRFRYFQDMLLREYSEEGKEGLLSHWCWYNFTQWEMRPLLTFFYIYTQILSLIPVQKWKQHWYLKLLFLCATINRLF